MNFIAERKILNKYFGFSKLGNQKETYQQLFLDYNQDDNCFLVNQIFDIENDNRQQQFLQEIEQSLNQSELNIISKVIIYSYLSRSQQFQNIYKAKKNTIKIFKNTINFYQQFFDQHKLILKFPLNIDNIQQKALAKFFNKKEINKLFELIQYKNFKELLNLIQNKPHLLSYDDNGLKLSHILCKQGDLDMVKFFFKNELSFDQLDLDEMTPIYYAIESKNIELIQFLLDQGANLEHKDTQYRTPFYWACHLGDIEIAGYLVKQGSDINIKSKLGRSPLGKCSFLGLEKMVNFLLSCKDIDLNTIDNKLRTPIHHASWGSLGGPQGKRFGLISIQDSPKIVQTLIDVGIDLNSQDIDGITALHSAASSDGYDSMIVLIKNNAKINATNKAGETPLFVACKFGHKRCADLLIKQGAQIDIKNNEGKDLFDISLYYQNDVFLYLVNKLKDLNYDEILEKVIKSDKINFVFLQKLLQLKDFKQYLWQNYEIILQIQDQQIFEYVFEQYFMNFIDRQNILQFLIKKNNYQYYNMIMKLDNKYFDNCQIDSFPFDLDDGFINSIIEYINLQQIQDSQIYDILQQFMKRQKQSLFINFVNLISFEQLERIMNIENQDNLNILAQSKIYNLKQIQDVLQYMEKDIKFQIPQVQIEIEEKSQIQQIQQMQQIQYSQKYIYPQLDIVNMQYKIIDQECQLQDLIQILEQQQIIFVDLEYYSQDNVQYICIIQISILNGCNYVIDNLVLNQSNYKLRGIFEGQILKVFHGCESDIKILNSNLRFNTMNVFDTARAYQLINKEQQQRSLKYLNKLYQKADWRIRPLPKSMIQYGIIDSYILIFLFQILNQELQQNNIQLKMDEFLIKQLSQVKYYIQIMNIIYQR